jgi:hypothetical protein
LSVCVQVPRCTSITFSSHCLSSSRSTLNLGFLIERKLAAILIIPSSWGSQRAGHSPRTRTYCSTSTTRQQPLFWRHHRVAGTHVFAVAPQPTVPIVQSPLAPKLLPLALTQDRRKLDAKPSTDDRSHPINMARLGARLGSLHTTCHPCTRLGASSALAPYKQPPVRL